MMFLVEFINYSSITAWNSFLHIHQAGFLIPSCVFLMSVGTILHRTVGADGDLPDGLAFWDSHKKTCAISIYFDLK